MSVVADPIEDPRRAMRAARIAEFRIFVRRFMRNPLGVVGLAIVLLLILVAIFAPLIATHDPYLPSLGKRLSAPSPEFWFGADELGRDIYSRLVYGSRLTLALVASNLDQHGVHKPDMRTVRERERLTVGPWDLEFFAVTHSIPDAMAVRSTDMREARCGNCGGTTDVSAHTAATRCAFCTHPMAVDPNTPARVPAHNLVPFAVDKTRAAEAFAQWNAGLWFRPNDLARSAQLQAMRGVYVPSWIFSAAAQSQWRAEAGYHYYETEYYTETDSNGNTVQRTRQVQRTRWVPASGSRQDFFDDELVCASRGLPPKLIAGICPYKLENLIPYEAAFLAGFVAEEYQVGLDEGWQTAQATMQREVEARCGRDVPGDQFVLVVVERGRHRAGPDRPQRGSPHREVDGPRVGHPERGQFLGQLGTEEVGRVQGIEQGVTAAAGARLQDGSGHGEHVTDWSVRTPVPCVS